MGKNVENVFVEFLVKMHDACETALDQLGPPKQGEPIEKSSYNPENLKWTRTDGPNGPYEVFPDFDTGENDIPKDLTAYDSLIKDLKNHDGKLNRNGLFYWLFNNSFRIGRKPTKKKAKRT